MKAVGGWPWPFRQQNADSRYGIAVKVLLGVVNEGG